MPIAWSALFSHLGFAGAIFGMSMVLTYLMGRVVRVMDIPGARSSHMRPVPKSGGVGIVTAFMLGTLALYFVADAARIEDRYFWGYLGCGLALAIVSFVDDVTQKSFAVKVGTQVVCMVVMLATGAVVSSLYVPFLGEVNLGWTSYPLTFLWLMGLTNAYNFMDGLDGLVGGVAVIAAIFLGIIALNENSVFVYLSSFILAASVLGFLVFNFPPARIFMGDVGSVFIGFTFAALAVIGANLDQGHLSFYIVPLLLFHFIFDTAFTFARRLLRGEPVHLAHRSHLYQLLNCTGFSHRAVSVYHYVVTGIQGLGALALVKADPAFRPYVFLPFLLYQAGFAWWVITRARSQGVMTPR